MTRSIDDVLEYDKRCSSMKFILKVVQDISDLDYQRRLWIEGIPGLIGNWEENIDDFDLVHDQFLKDLTPESNPEFGLSAHQIDELWKLRNILNSYDPKVPKYSYVDPRKVLADPEWHKVVECAQETLKAFEGYEVPTDDMLKF